MISLLRCFHNGIILIVICFSLFLRHKFISKKRIIQIIVQKIVFMNLFY